MNLLQENVKFQLKKMLDNVKFHSTIKYRQITFSFRIIYFSIIIIIIIKFEI